MPKHHTNIGALVAILSTTMLLSCGDINSREHYVLGQAVVRHETGRKTVFDYKKVFEITGYDTMKVDTGYVK
jgi:hypothetical protein